MEIDVVENFPVTVVGHQMADIDGKIGGTHSVTRQVSEHHIGQDDADAAQHHRTRRRPPDALGTGTDVKTVSRRSA